MYVSPTVGKEMGQAPEPLGRRLLSLLDEWGAVVIRPTSEVRALANAFVERGIIPLRYSADAEHLAFAIVGGADAIVSWNLDHIVKLKTKMAVRVLAVERGYRLIDVVTPLEVLEGVD